MAKTLVFSISDHVATISFNRPNAMNCFDDVMADELAALTLQVRDDHTIRALLLKGAGALFMAGGDIRLFHARLDKMPAGVKQIVETLNVSINNLMSMPKPVLASVHGSVAGVGVSFMLACDLVIAAEDTKFTMAYSGIGLSPDGGAAFNLPRLVGSKKALEWIFFSEVFTADTALKYGLVNWVVQPNLLDEETKKILLRLAKGPTASYARAKKLVNESWQHTLENHLANEAEAFAACTTTVDFKQGVNAFLEKRKPEFCGQ